MSKIRNHDIGGALLAALLMVVPLLAEEPSGFVPFSVAEVEPLDVPPTPIEAVIAESVQPSPRSNVYALATAPAEDDWWYHLNGKVRGYYLNDQRIEFTGNEATFGAEGVLEGGLHQQLDAWELSVEGQLFINQPFDRNQLRDTTWRRSYAGNFAVEAFEVSQLYLAARQDDWYFAAGKFVTPFGRFYFPNYMNNFQDSPFIRSEAILFRETGVVGQWTPDGYNFTAALTNGGPDRDTNSSKALVARAGIDEEFYALGASVKWQDGIGSENQKQYNSHAGCDAMYAWGNWQFSTEFIYDEYGFRDTTFDPNDVFWGRSIYHRDINRADQQAVYGYGYYFDLGYYGERWEFHANYGQYHPQQLGDPVHDVGSRRWLLKGSYHASPNWELYQVILLENSVPWGLGGKSRDGFMMLTGAQFAF